jgi:hypothetical protein
MAPNDVGILLYHDVDFAVLRYKRVGAGSVDTGTINAFGANSQAPLAGLLDAKGQLYFTAGIRLYRAPSFVPDPMFTPVDTPFDPPAGIHVQRGEDLPLGIYVSGDTVFWEKEDHRGLDFGYPTRGDVRPHRPFARERRAIPDFRRRLACLREVARRLSGLGP